MAGVSLSHSHIKTLESSVSSRWARRSFQRMRLLACIVLAPFFLSVPSILLGQDLPSAQAMPGPYRLAPVNALFAIGGTQVGNPSNGVLPKLPPSYTTPSTTTWPIPTSTGSQGPPYSGTVPALIGPQGNRPLPAFGTSNLSGARACSAGCLPGEACSLTRPDAGECFTCGYFTTGGVCPHCGRVHAGASKESYPTIKLNGMAQMDVGWIGQDDANQAILGDIQDGADIRRARLGAKGDFSEKLGYLVELDFAFAQRINVTDVYLDIRDVPWLGTIRIGRWRLPFNMDARTSVKELTFLERSLPFTFAPFRQIGAGFQGITVDETTTWAASVFRFPTDEFGGNVGDNGGYSTVGRITHAIPLGPRERGSALHVGGAYSLIDPANDRVRYATSPEIGIGETGGGVPVGVPSSIPAFVDTGILDVNLVNLFDVELAMTAGPWHVQSELVYALVDQTSGVNLAFPAVYAQVGYVLTGETRPYNWKNAVLGRIVPTRSLGDGGWGAWEIAVRGSTIDLSDRDVDGGVLTDITAGLNWYLSANAKIQFNYIHASLERPSSVDSNANIVALRTQVDF